MPPTRIEPVHAVLETFFARGEIWLSQAVWGASHAAARQCARQRRVVPPIPARICRWAREWATRVRENGRGIRCSSDRVFDGDYAVARAARLPVDDLKAVAPWASRKRVAHLRHRRTPRQRRGLDTAPAEDGDLTTTLRSFVVAPGRFLAGFPDPLEIAGVRTAIAYGEVDAIAESVATAGGRTLVDTGLFYSYTANGAYPGRTHFVP